MCLPIPKPLSRIQLDWQRLFTPPAPAKASAPSTTATSSPDAHPASVTAFGTSEYASPLMATTSTMTRKTRTTPTFRNSTRSIVL